MKRAGGLFERIAEPEILRHAFWRAARGKADRPVVRAFRAELADELRCLRADLLAECLPVGQFHSFVIRDPKPRRIHAPSFRERVLHHAIVQVCEPIFERSAIHDTYACRRGKGTLAALRRAQAFSRRWPYVLKIDVRRYYDSIDHDRLNALLARRFKEPRLLRLFARIVSSYHTDPGKGLPIGALTSQHLANLYLGALDRFVKEQLRVRGYLRYMDDALLWGEARGSLRAQRRAIARFLAEDLALELRRDSQLLAVGQGVSFLGYRVDPAGLRLGPRLRRRLRRHLRRAHAFYRTGRWDEAAVARHVEPVVAISEHARARAFRTRILAELGPGTGGDGGFDGARAVGRLAGVRQLVEAIQDPEQAAALPEPSPQVGGVRQRGAGQLAGQELAQAGAGAQVAQAAQAQQHRDDVGGQVQRGGTLGQVGRPPGQEAGRGAFAGAGIAQEHHGLRLRLAGQHEGVGHVDVGLDEVGALAQALGGKAV